MARTTKFTKVAAGGLDRGDVSLNRFGMIPVVQKSAGVSAIGQARIGVMPTDGGEILEILTMVDIAVGGSAATMLLDFGTSANTSAFGVVVVSGVGRYGLPVKNASHGNVATSAIEHPLTVHVSGSNYTVVSGGQHILVTVASASGGASTAPGFICYTTYLQNLANS